MPRALPTDKMLMTQAMAIVFRPPRNGVVLWSGKQNQDLAQAFCNAHPRGRYVTLESLLQQDHADFYSRLCSLPWRNAEEIWLTLSARLAEAAKGTVHVFAAGVASGVDENGPDGIGGAHRSPHPPRNPKHKAAYCNSVFEKVEGPALDGNTAASPVLLMGRNINSRPERY